MDEKKRRRKQGYEEQEVNGDWRGQKQGKEETEEGRKGKNKKDTKRGR